MTVSKYIRSRSLSALFATRCPLPSTVHGVKRIADEEDRHSSVKQTATLMLGALIRGHRQCIQIPKASFASAEEDLNHDLLAALDVRDTGRAKEILGAMEASASGSHLHAIQRALKNHGELLQTIGLKSATQSALTVIGYQDASHDAKLRFALLSELDNPSFRKTELAFSPERSTDACPQ